MENTTSAASPITGHTGLICLLGSPCAHSVSPMMHNASFEALGLDYRYLAFDVNEETLPTAVAGLKVLGARGFNLTMPDKNLMVSLCIKLPHHYEKRHDLLPEPPHRLPPWPRCAHRLI